MADVISLDDFFETKESCITKPEIKTILDTSVDEKRHL